jgi:glucose-1-phosphate cytidylyltransferase
MRLRESSEQLPKPMVSIGYRPILWHVMRFFAHFGHREFILCLGYRADAIKNYFLNYDECLSNDFKLSQRGKRIDLLGRDIDDWEITFVDTGIHTSIGQRLRAVRHHLEGEKAFLASYADGLTDVPLQEYLDVFMRSGKVAGLLCVAPTWSFHVVDLDEHTGQAITNIRHIAQSGTWVNGGYFAFRSEIFDYIEHGEDLVDGPFVRLIEAGQLFGYRYRGFWQGMDTLKDRQELEDLHASGIAPWQVWNHGHGSCRVGLLDGCGDHASSKSASCRNGTALERPVSNTEPEGGYDQA